MRRTLELVALATGLILATGLVLATGASAGGKTVQATLSGKCAETDTLDQNGALKSAKVTCTGAVKCACGGSTRLDYSVTASEPGTGANGRESGTLTATGPSGTLTFALKGIHSSVGGGSGTWKLIKTVGYQGVKLTRSGHYSTTVHAVRQIPLSMNTIVKISASLGCWAC
ncbi:MAG TPA: hypothetical protein VGM80_00035 [Gaiellaceae bacterium]